MKIRTAHHEAAVTTAHQTERRDIAQRDEGLLRLLLLITRPEGTLLGL